MKDELIKIIGSNEWRVSGPHPEFMVEIQMCKLLKKQVFIYGASVHAYSLVRYLISEGIDSRTILDEDEKISDLYK